ncbi:MAG: non-canonical purine NTP pyrophosphatase [Helicobacteraceae bacterium]
MDIVVASSNQDKIKEIKAFFAGFNVLAYAEVMDSFEIDETGESFQENALIKARAISAKLANTRLDGALILADDSGLSVEALAGAPGLYSARYAGEGATSRQNLDKLIATLKDLGVESSPAFYTCAIALIHRKACYTAHGFLHGRVCAKERGQGGFGYDPVFIPQGYEQTLGEIPEVKAQISHRTRALELAAIVAKLWL